ncbi:MAG: pyrimidine dimer DNA glycosylase/endonuclease V [bacterium]|nr:pyrimidine dimer DNA glycosylase/endonuclease V [bacterium]
MRIWDLQPSRLCRKHLLAEHRELHGFWNILTKHNEKGGYSRHPETLRWKGRLKALYLRHETLMEEFTVRGYKHLTPLNVDLATGNAIQSKYINTAEEQEIMLRDKPCDCLLVCQNKENK